MDSVIILAIAACLLSGGVVYVVMQVRHFGANQEEAEKLLKAQSETAAIKKKLLGYTRYVDYLETSKKALADQLKPPVAKIVREYVHVVQVPKDQFKLRADATAVITYSVEFNFAMDVNPESLEVMALANGVGLKIRSPVLMGEPVVKPLSHQIISTTGVQDEKAVLADIHPKFALLASRYGTAMSTEAPVRAMCKLKALECLRDALAKQSGAQHLPAIFVDFK